MNISDVISVDPGRTTLGYLHPKNAARLLRAASSSDSERNHKRKVLNFFFATHAPGVDSFGKYMLLLRSLFAAYMIVAGVFILQNPIYAPSITFSPSVFAGILITTGGSLLLGLFARFSMLVSAIVLTAVALNSFSAGVFDSAAILGLFSSFAFLIMGSGKFSLDFLIKKAIVKYAMKSKQARKNKRMTYKAFSLQEN